MSYHVPTTTTTLATTSTRTRKRTRAELELELELGQGKALQYEYTTIERLSVSGDISKAGWLVPGSPWGHGLMPLLDSTSSSSRVLVLDALFH